MDSCRTVAAAGDFVVVAVAAGDVAVETVLAAAAVIG